MEVFRRFKKKDALEISKAPLLFMVLIYQSAKKLSLFIMHYGNVYFKQLCVGCQ